MGVPKFFRYISERYPNLSELVGSAELPQFDNMYLDMNGIIHVCSHPDDSNVHFRMSEEQMFNDILRYIDTLFRMIQPQKLFFMAVDGVAPRAKMNQQRGRRFQSARTALELIEKAKKAGEKLPEESRFDSNCITPGTAFMVRLQEALKHFVKMKMSTDPSWRHCRFILSGHETPGEGEHKIMEYIRFLKAQPNYDPNTRHCLYGLDADLIMLGLCTHELNFALLREEVKFDKKAKRPMSVDETRFYLLHLGLLREYLEMEFIELKEKLKFPYDLEKIIDDWIFMCFMVGNDFIPHLPNLHINSNALPILYRVYKTVLPKSDGYLNEGGKLNLKRLEMFMEEMSEIDRELFREHYEDLKLLEMKYDNDETFGVDLTANEITPETKSDLDALIAKTKLDLGSDESGSDESSSDDLSSDEEFMFKGAMLKDDSEDDDDDEDLDDDEMFEKEFQLHKRNYYINKMKYPEMTKEVLAEQAEIYITALQWTLNYYYRGVCSWGWFYPHHYAPYISDIRNFKNFNIKFMLGKPFLPFEQLLSVLPAASKELLPEAYHKLMTDPSSKIIDYYPVDFETDLNGKKNEWEALVLIPFINENRLIEAMNECNDKLTENERRRNIHGPMLQYDYCANDQGTLPAMYGQQMVAHVFCKETLIERSDLHVAEERLVLGPCKGALKDAYFPGFPTMRHLKHSGHLASKRIKVFQQPSRNESMIITIDEEPLSLDIQSLAREFIDKEIYVGWPHLRLAKVIAVSDFTTRVEKTGAENYEKGNREYLLLAKQLKDHNLLRLGIDLGDVTQLLHVVPLLNHEYLNTGDGKLKLSKNWSKIPLAVAPISIVHGIKVHETCVEQIKSVEDVFTKGSTVFMMNKGFYGCKATILESAGKPGRFRVQTVSYPQPDFTKAKRVYQHESLEYANSYTASATIGINYRVFNRITGVVLVVAGEKRFPISDNDKKVNIGLQLKYPKQSDMLPGYTKSVKNNWLYSQKAAELVQSYALKFPKVFELMDRQGNGQNDFIFESELNEGRKEGEESMLKEISQWLREQPHNSVSRQPCGTDCLTKSAVEEIVATVNKLKSEPVRSVTLQIKPHLLYKPNLNDINVSPDPAATFELFDRVVVARDQHIVPLGQRGTIISIFPVMDPNPVRQENINAIDYVYEVVFDEPFEQAASIPGVAEKCVFKVRRSILINITHGLGRPREERQPNQMENNWRMPNEVNANNNTQQAWRNNGSKQPIERNGKDSKNWPSLSNGKKLPEPPTSRNDNNQNIIIAPRRNATNNKEAKGNKPNNPSQLNNLKDIPVPTQQFAQLNLTNQFETNKLSAPLPKQLNNTQGNSADALKKLLRIGGAENAVNSVPTASINVESKPIDLTALFGKPANAIEEPDMNSLPKPPANWHQKPAKSTKAGPKEAQVIIEPPTVPQIQRQQQEQQQQPQQQSQQPPPHQQNPLNMTQPAFPNQYYHPHMRATFPANVVPVPIPIPMPMVPFGHPPSQFHPMMHVPRPMHMPMPVIQRIPMNGQIDGYPPFMNPNHHVRMTPPINFNYQNQQPKQQQQMQQFSMNAQPSNRQGPKGPQNLNVSSDNTKVSSHNSAFIPLQAIRNASKGKANANEPSSQPAVETKPKANDTAPVQEPQNLTNKSGIVIANDKARTANAKKPSDPKKIASTSSKNVKAVPEKATSTKPAVEKKPNAAVRDSKGKEKVEIQKPRLACNFSVNPNLNKPKPKNATNN